MSLSVAPLAATLGAVVTGVRLAELDDATFRQIVDAFHDHALLVFPAQHLDDAEQIAFARHFGPLEDVAGYEGITPVSNQAPDGSLRADDHPSMQILRGNEGWHTDSSYLPVSAMASMLSAHVLPSAGGGTEWADMRAAYDALPVDTQQRLAALSACHSIKYSQARIGFTDATLPTYGYDVADAPRRSLVKVHPVTGRPALFIGRHAFAVKGLADDESEALLDGLLADACQPPRTYEHRWTPGDLVMWDNRCTLHRARPYNKNEPRVMHHSRIAGNPATEGV
jgi:alpha-ketoglutarate-dependent taurine dioxygenase